LAGACYTGANGAFTVPVIPGQWEVMMDSEGLAAYGYLGLNDHPQVYTTTGSVSSVTLALPKATALFYGSVFDNQGHPLAGIYVLCQDNNDQYVMDYRTDANGYFVGPAVGGLSNNLWRLEVDSDTAPTNYLFTRPSFNQNGGTNLNAGQALLVNFPAVLATNRISGWLKDNSGNPIAGIGVWANATINSVDYSPYVDTDANGNYSMNVANGTWTVGISSSGGGSSSLPANYVCPPNQTLVISNNNGTADFIALSANNHITGYVKDNSGNPIAGVGVWAMATISGVDYYQGSVDTDSNGNYSMNVANGTWSVAVNTGGGSDNLPGNYVCSSSQTVVISNNNGTANFSALPANNHITGYLKDNGGNPIAGVGVFANATINSVDYFQPVDTDANGNYSMNVANGTWIVSLNNGGAGDTLPGNYVCPPNQTLVIANNNGTANFVALPANSHITGHVQYNGNPVSGVQVYAYANINGAVYQSQMDTDSSGNYSLNVANGSWTVDLNPSSGSDSLDAILGIGTYQFPANQNVDISNGNDTANFTVQPLVPLQVTTTSLPGGPVGVYYDQSLGASGGQPPYTWWLPGGTMSLPPGQSGDMGFSSDGTISGTPSTAGTYTFWVGVYDSASPPNTVTQQVSLTISQSGADVVDYYDVKMESFVQLDPTTLVPNTNVGPFSAYLGLVQSAIGSVPLANVTLPGGSQRALPSGSSGIKLQTQEGFANQTLIDTTYPPGNYTFSLFAVNDGVQSLVLSMPPAAYPNPPRINNFAAAQSINPLADFTLQWDPISSATTNDSLWVVVTGASGVVFSSPEPATDHAAALPGTATSVIVPASTFLPGHAYTGWITYFRTTSLNLSAYPGAAGLTMVAAMTSFPLTSSSGAPRLDQAVRLSNTQFRFQLSGAASQTYTVQVLTNLASTNWSTLMTTNLSANSAFIQDNQATNTQRFYRVKVGL
jgi:uncharacterized GH25 family protein